jgi:hypothetical protein
VSCVTNPSALDRRYYLLTPAQEEDMNHHATRLALGTTAVALAALLAACGDDAAGAGSDGASPLTITSPTDGADVGSSVKVSWDSSVELGEPDTGRDHVHVFVDGQENDYTVVGENEFTVEGLSPGEHTINVTLQHADHSSAGAEDEVDVNVTDGSGPTEAPTTKSTPQDPGYDY